MTAMPEEPRTATGDIPPAQPRVVIIVSQGPVFSADMKSLAGRTVTHIPIKMSDQPMAVMATTVATGVDPVFHGIATKVQIDPSDLSRRILNSTDCLYPCFWKDASNAGLRTQLLDWPMTGGDAVLHDSLSPEQAISKVAMHPGIERETVLPHLKGEATGDKVKALTNLLVRLDTVLSAADEILKSSKLPDLFGMVLRSSPQLIAPKNMLDIVGGRVAELLSSLPDSTCVLVVHNQKDLTGDHATANPWTLSIIGGEVIPHHQPQHINLRAIGGAIRLLAGIPCPIGVSLPKWPFLSLPEMEEGERPIPQGVKEDTTDWDDLVNRVLAMPSDDEAAFEREQNIEVLKNRFKVLSINSIQGKKWVDLECHSHRLVRLGRLPVYYWWHIYALERLGKKVELQAAVTDLLSAYPGLPITLIAESLLLVQSDSEEAVDKLKTIDPRQLRIKSALGTLGRLCLGLGLEQQGVDAIRLALQNRLAIPDDRTDLAQYFLRKQQPEEAIRVLGSLGKVPKNLAIGILRLKILLALGDREKAEHHAAMILNQYPGEKKVLELMGS